MAVGGRGMTLIEVAVAAAVVMAISIAATGACLSARAAAGADQGRTAAVSGVAAQAETLRALPFDDPAAASATPAADLLGAVFPHADPARDTPTAYWAGEPADGCPAGTFFTVREAACGPLTIAATFLTACADGLQPLNADLLSGYDHAAGVCPPAAVLLLRVSAHWRAGTRGGTVARTLVIADRPAGLCPVATPSPT